MSGLGYDARVLADSVAPSGVRLTTLEVTFPRMILAEFNTHRMLSRNSASSRAIPPEKQVERVKNSPFIPVFGSRVAGMGQGELDGRTQRRMQAEWLRGRDRAVDTAQKLIDLGADKSHTNRVLEPYMWHTVIVTATEWDNFFALRIHPAAAPEIKLAAERMQEAMWLSEPEIKRHDGPLLRTKDAHLPLVSPDEYPPDDGNVESWMMVSAGRCARVSFDTHENFEPPSKSAERAEALRQAGHWSPFEHQALPLDRVGVPSGREGNFRGWEQFRKQFAGESNFKTLCAIQGEA